MPSLSGVWGFVEQSLQYHRVLYLGVVCDRRRSLASVYDFYRWRVFRRQVGRRDFETAGITWFPVYVCTCCVHSRLRAVAVILNLFWIPVRIWGWAVCSFDWLGQSWFEFPEVVWRLFHGDVASCYCVRLWFAVMPLVTWAYEIPAWTDLGWSVEIGVCSVCLVRNVGYNVCCNCLWIIHPL